MKCHDICRSSGEKTSRLLCYHFESAENELSATF